MSAPKMLPHLALMSRTKSQKQQERSGGSEHFSFLFSWGSEAHDWKLHRWRMLDLLRCRVYMQAAREGLCVEISRRCLMSSVLNTLLMGAARLSLYHCHHAGIILFWGGLQSVWTALWSLGIRLQVALLTSFRFIPALSGEILFHNFNFQVISLINMFHDNFLVCLRSIEFNSGGVGIMANFNVPKFAPQKGLIAHISNNTDTISASSNENIICY